VLTLEPPAPTSTLATVPDDPFEGYFRASLAALGIPVEPGHALAEPLPPWLPAALSAYYRIAGRHPVNEMHNRLLPADELQRAHGKLIFAVENQGSVIWGLDDSDDAADPEVWQGQPIGRDWNEGILWYSEEMPLSRFLMTMWTYTITGEAPVV
jgi:hypothetical protein